MATSISDIIAQNTVSDSGVRPADVPTDYSWYNGKTGSASASTPPSGFTSVTAWGQVYQEAGGSSYYNPNATVDVANAKTYVHLKATGEWMLVQDQATSSIGGGHFVNDFSGNSSISMKLTKSADGTVAMSMPPAGYNDHFWPTSRGVYPADAVDGVYVQMDMKVSDPSMDLVANIGADWWRSQSAPFVDGFGNNPGAGMNNWAKLSTEWTTLGYYSISTSQFQADPPPSLLGSGQTPPVTGTPDTTAPTAPKIVAFTPDTGTVGDKVTTASVLTLSGTAEAGSTVKLFDGEAQIGTAKASAIGAWSVATSQLSTGTHNLSAKATDAAGNTSLASSPLSVRVDAVPSPPVTSPPVTDTTAPTAPKIVAFTPDTGTVGDKVTTASVLTLSGTAEAGSTVKLFDGEAQIGTAKASAIGAWSVATSQLSTGTHNLSAKATDAAGNTSLASSPLSVRVDAVPSPPVTSPPGAGANLLENGSFEASSVPGRWESFSSLPGWTALTGGTIQLWDNLNNVKATNGSNFGELDASGARDGLFQTVETVAGQTYDLTFDARSRPGTPGSTNKMEVLWNDQVVASVDPRSGWNNFQFSVTGTGGEDRLTFREAARNSGDGRGALYDNVSLVASETPSTVTQLVTQPVTQPVTQSVTQPVNSVSNPAGGPRDPARCHLSKSDGSDDTILGNKFAEFRCWLRGCAATGRPDTRLDPDTG